MSTVQQKNLATGAVGKLANTQALVSRNAANSADLSLISADASNIGQLGIKTQHAFTPSSGNDIANKTYVDTQVSGVSGANTALSNLASVAINADLLPGSNNARSLGSATLKYLAAFIGTLQDASSVIVLDIINRTLKNTSGTTLISFSGTNAQTSVTPSTGNDIANKTYVDSVASNQKTWGLDVKTLAGGDITNQYVDLAQPIVSGSQLVHFAGVWQRPVTDYTVSLTGGAGGVTRITFAGDLATGGASALVATDVLYIQYQY